MGVTPRYRHWIQPASEGKWPSAIVCVDCCSDAVNEGEGTLRQRETLLSWHTATLMSHNGEYRCCNEGMGKDAADLLATLATAADHYPNLWVVSYKCTRVWSLLGMWEGIEDGRIKVCDTDYRNSEAFRNRVQAYRLRQEDPLRPLGGEETARLRQGTSGYLVVEDPPNILRGRLHDSCQPITWVDVRNYGVDSLDDAMPGADTVQWLARFIGRIAHVCRTEHLSSLKATAGSQAVSAWRHNFLTESVHVHTDERATAMEAAGYCGGRCEAGRIGVISTPCYHLDFRSQYGWVCANCTLPTGLLAYREGGHRAAPTAGIDLATATADVTIETEEPAYPVKRDGGVIYPVGRFRTVLCGPELGDAAEHGRIVRVHAIATYSMGYPLREYALKMYELRCREELEGVPGSAQWIKRLIVSLPGKLGQKNHRWIDCPDVMPQEMYGEWYGESDDGDVIRYRSIGGIVQRDCTDGFAADSVPALAAFVTSFGRSRLLSAIRIAGYGNVFYYDTDSIICNKEGYDRLKESELMLMVGMGALTLRSMATTTEIRGVKYYVEDKQVKCSGLAKGHVVDIGDGVHYARYLSAIEQSRKGQRPESLLVHGTYLRAEVYNQGVVGPDGVVRPIRLDE